MSKRQNQVNKLLVRLAAEFFRDTAGTNSLITVTDVSVSSDLRNATVSITVLPTEKEAEALAFSKRRRSDFREYVKKHTDMKYLPYFDMVIDAGERHRQHIDELLNH